MTWLGRLVLLGALLASSAASAQSFPNRTVTIVVTSAAGAATDVLTRAVAQRLSQKWGQSIIVENRGGGGHNFAATAVMKAEPDGHTLLASETGFWTSQPHLYAAGQARLRRRTPTSSRLPALPAFRSDFWCIPRCREIACLS